MLLCSLLFSKLGNHKPLCLPLTNQLHSHLLSLASSTCSHYNVLLPLLSAMLEQEPFVKLEPPSPIVLLVAATIDLVIITVELVLALLLEAPPYP